MGRPNGDGPIGPDPHDPGPPRSVGRPAHERRVLIGAVAAVGTVAVLATGAVVAVAVGGGDTARDAAPMALDTAAPGPSRVPATTTPPTAPRTTAPRMSIPPLFGGETEGPGTSAFEVKVDGSGSANLITLGIPGSDTVGEQQLPWSRTFRTNSFLVSVTVLGYQGSVSCSITKDGTVVSSQTATDTGGGAPLICTALR